MSDAPEPSADPSDDEPAAPSEGGPAGPTPEDSGGVAPDTPLSDVEAGPLLLRVAVAVVIALVVVAGGLVVVPSGGGPGGTPVNESEMSLPEYQRSTNMQELPASGEVRVDPSAVEERGVVVVDQSNSNRVTRADLEPVVEALVDLNYEVRFSSEENMTKALADADAFIVVDPGNPYDEEQISAIRNFTDRGGHLLVLAEPTRRSIAIGAFGATITGVPSLVDTLLHEYNTTVGARYLYNQEHNDGNFKNIVARPASQAGIGVDRTAFYTAAAVRTRTGRPLLFAAEGTRRSMTDDGGRYAVAVRDGNFVAVGDTSFLRFQHYNVADNEQFIAYLVEFLATGDGELPGSEVSGPVGDAAGTETPSGTNNSSSALDPPPRFG